MKTIPRPVWRCLRWYALPLVVVPGLVVALFTNSRQLIFVSGCVFSFCAVASSVGLAVSIAKLGKRVARAKGRICIHCGYDLSGNEEDNVCPECGQVFDGIQDIERWRAWTAFDKSTARR